MLPVLPPTFDQIKARANLVHSVSSYSYVDNLYFLLGWRSRHAALSEAQKQYFYVMHPTFVTVEDRLRRIRMIASFLMFIASILLSLPMAGVALGVFAFAAPYLMPLLIAAAMLAGVAFVFSTITFIAQERVLDDPQVKILLENVEVLTKDFDTNKEKINEAMKRLEVLLQYSRHHNGDKVTRRVLKDMKAFLEYEERSFMYEAHVGMLLYAIVDQVEADNKALSEDMQQLLHAFHSDSLSRLTMDFYSASVLMPELIEDVHSILDVVQANMQLESRENSEKIVAKLQDMGERQKQLSEKLLNRMDGSYTALHYLTEYYSIIHSIRQDLQTIHRPDGKQVKEVGGLNKKPVGSVKLARSNKRSQSLRLSNQKGVDLIRSKSAVFCSKLRPKSFPDRQ
jgi:hypothetical protein